MSQEIKPEVKSDEIKPYAVYTTGEVEKLLKISNSTMKRLIKRGLIKANKVGKQYRILGLELLHLVSPEVEQKAVKVYLDVKKKLVEKTSDW